ncbi:MAG TPA: hypothetical protein VJ793_08550 [Anaerolineae bacterium]|nr:hypothetical protein [Anaerolineae bacterium]
MKEQTKRKKQLTLGAQVNCLDGKAGTLSRIITDPESRRPTYLVVKRGRLRSREIVVPVSLVAEVTPEAVTLDITRKALVDSPDYEVTVRKGRYQKPMPVPDLRRPVAIYTPPSNSGYMVLRQRNVPDRSVEVRQGMRIWDCGDREVGKVEGIVVSVQKRQGKYIVFRPKRASSPQLIPADLVEDVTSKGVRLRIDREYAGRLPIYSPRLAKKWA